MKVLIRDFMTGKGKLENVESIEGARSLVKSTINKYSMSISDWNKIKKVGEVYEENGECVAKIEYNGVVWLKDENNTTWKIDKK